MTTQSREDAETPGEGSSEIAAEVRQPVRGGGRGANPSKSIREGEATDAEVGEMVRKLNLDESIEQLTLRVREMEKKGAVDRESHSDGARDSLLAEIHRTIERNTAEAPTEPGFYRLPCGECFVDFFIGHDGVEHWLVPGDGTTYTRDTVALARHGDHPWERLYTLADAASHIQKLAEDDGIAAAELISRLQPESEHDAPSRFPEGLPALSLEQDVLTNPVIMAEIAAHRANPADVIEEEPHEMGASEDEQIARTIRERTEAGPTTPLADLAEKLGLDPDDYR